MKTSFVVVALLLALACFATAQPARRNATASAADDEPTVAPKRNATAVAGAVKNATSTLATRRANATTGAAAGSAANATAAESPATSTKASEAPAPSPKPKSSGAAVATTGFAAAVAGSVLLLQLVL